jgi:hypothetical protein
VVGRAARALGCLFVDQRISSTIEVKGNFTLYSQVDGALAVSHRGSWARLPRPLNVEQALHLVNSPIFATQHLEPLIEQYPSSLIRNASEIASHAHHVGGRLELDEANAYHRARIACFEFSRRYGRDA